MRLTVIFIVLLWVIPTAGVLITSFRPEEQAETTGWWTVFAHLFDTSQWTFDNYTQALDSQSFSNAFLNSLAVALPATVIPITIAAFAAYAFSWMEFRGRYAMFVTVVGLLVVPLQMALIPILRLYSNGASIGGLKVVTERGWFAARPSGTEAKYKVYAESFIGIEHLRRIQEEAQAIVRSAIGS